MVKRNIRFFSCALIVVLCFTMISPSAFAEMEPSRFAQWMKTATTACNILAESTLPVIAPIEDFLFDPFNIVEGVFTDINYSFPCANFSTPSMTLESYLKRSFLQIRGDTVSIDGVDYQDIWVSNQAANAFRLNVLDLETAFDIASNQSGIFVSGEGFYDGIPIFCRHSSPDTYFSQRYLIEAGTWAMGDGSVIAGYSTTSSSSWYWLDWLKSNGNRYVSGAIYSPSLPYYFQLYSQSFPSTVYFDILNVQSLGRIKRVSTPGSGLYVSSPFDFTWVSQNIPASQLSSDDGIHLLVPNNPEQFSDTDVQQKINNFNLNLNNNFELNTPINLGSDNNYSLFDSLFDIAFDLDINPSFGPYNSYSPEPSPSPEPTPTSAPTPDPVPVPTPAPSEAPYDQIGTTPWSVLEEWLRSLREYLETIVFYLQQILDEIKNLPENFSNIWDTQSSGFGNWLKSILQQIGDGLSTGFQRLHDDFLLLFDDLKLFNIEFFGNVVDALEDSFEPLLDVLESVTSIWRYVVAWVGNISAPLSWSLSALGSAGSYFLSPFYAIAAGSIVIAIYKRFMR